jgi:hypothetical protein
MRGRGRIVEAEIGARQPLPSRWPFKRIARAPYFAL